MVQEDVCKKKILNSWSQLILIKKKRLLIDKPNYWENSNFDLVMVQNEKFQAQVMKHVLLNHRGPRRKRVIWIDPLESLNVHRNMVAKTHKYGNLTVDVISTFRADTISTQVSKVYKAVSRAVIANCSSLLGCIIIIRLLLKKINLSPHKKNGVYCFTGTHEPHMKAVRLCVPSYCKPFQINLHKPTQDRTRSF